MAFEINRTRKKSIDNCQQSNDSYFNKSDNEFNTKTDRKYTSNT